MAIENLKVEENCEMAMQDDAIVQVIIDAGFSADVSRRFY